MAVRLKDRIEANIRQSDKVNSSLSIQLNSGTATVYDGSSAKSINVTPAAIGAPTTGGTGATGTWGINVSGSAAKLTTSRTIALTGDVTGSGSFNGSANLSITTTVADNSHNHTAANISDLKFAICGDNLLSRDKIVSRGLTSFTYDAETQIYTCVAPINSGAWGFGITFSSTGRRIVIPRGKTIYFSLEVYPTVDCTWSQDINNNFASGTASSSNDNDTNRSSNSKSLEANKWQKCWFSYSAPADRDLIDVDSNWGIVTTNFTTETTFYLRNIQAQIGDIPTAFQTPTLSIATTSNTSAGTIYLLGVTGNTSGELQYNGDIYMNGSNGTITAKGFNGNATSASKVNGVIPEWAGSVSWDDTGWIAAWNADGTKIKALNKNSFAPASHSHSYLPLSGGTMTGNLNFSDNKGITGTMAGGSDSWKLIGSGTDDYGVLQLVIADNRTSDYFDIVFDDWDEDPMTSIRFGGARIDSYVPLYGAVWNDYAEYRSQNEPLIAGHIAYCDDDGKLKYTTERLQKFEGVVSDTFGFAIGETDECKTPLAVSGRALVYCDPEDHFHSGDCVCAGPDGKAYRMTREEVTMYPDRIVGVVSEIPTYERWGTGNVEVNGRIWIKVK